MATVSNYAPDHWLPAAATFAYAHLIERLESGDRPAADLFTGGSGGADGYLPGAESEDVRIPEGARNQIDIAWESLESAWETLEQRLAASDLDRLRPLHARVVGMLPIRFR